MPVALISTQHGDQSSFVAAIAIAIPPDLLHRWDMCMVILWTGSIMSIKISHTTRTLKMPVCS
jgi:hypothetical protein